MAVEDITTKCCTKCCESKPLTEFCKDAYKKDGLSTRCKTCRSTENSEWRAKNPEQVKKNNIEWYAKNADKARAYSREYARKHPEQVKATIAIWVEKNKDRVSELNKDWREKNKERHLSNVREWMNKNKDKVKSYRSNRKAKTRGKLGKLSNGLARNLYVLQKGKCACCRNKLANTYHMDHIIPLALGGLHVDKNIQLLCAPCNLSKGAAYPIDFMQKRGFLL